MTTYVITLPTGQEHVVTVYSDAGRESVETDLADLLSDGDELDQRYSQ